VASIKEGRRPGSWEVRYYVPGGKRRSKTVYGTYKQAERQAAVLEHEAGSHVATEGLTLGAALAIWLSHGATRRSPTSNRAIESRSRVHTVPRLGHYAVERITHQLLEGFYNDLAERLSYGAIRNIHSDISGALRLAVRNGHIERSPADKVEFHRWEEPKEIALPTVDELNAFLAVVDAKTTRASAELGIAVRLAIVTGARRGEICGLRWGDIDLATPRISIMRNVIDLPGAQVQVRQTKTGVRRHPVISAPLADRIATHRFRWPTLDPGDSSPLFPGRPDEPLSPTALSDRFKKAREEAGLRFRFHDLRHYAVSVWLTEMPMHDVSRAIGHRQVTTTVNTYGHAVEQGIDRRAAEAVARRITL
jgi:integrase